MDADVVVIGAGLAGLTAARELVRAGREVVVLEARDRVGGRTYTREIDGAAVDLGGQWLGPTQHRMLRLCSELGIGTFPTHCEGTKLLDDGKKLRRFDGKIPSLSLFHLLEAQLNITRLERMCRALPDDLRASSEMDATTVTEWQRKMRVTQATRALFDVAVRTVFGAEPAELSMLWFVHYLKTGGGFEAHIDTPGGAQQDRIVGGAQPISNALAAALGARVRLSHPVRAIEHDAEAVTAHADGATVKARLAVVCVPPALAARIEFRPGLPGARDMAMQRMPMGATVKVFARYDKAFWRTRGMSGEYVSTRSPLSMAIDNTSRDGSHPGLLGFIVGRHAVGWSSRDREARRGAVLDQLARAFGDEARKPISVVEQDWAEEPWTRGCPVGNALPGVLTAEGVSLREPVGRLHWAGTETGGEWTGYMEGAVESGERVAREVLTRLGGG